MCGCTTPPHLLALLLLATGGCTAQEGCDSEDGLMARSAGLMATCCPGGPTSCPMSIPTYCSSDCSNALLTFVADCNRMFTAAGLGPAIAPVVAVCEAAGPTDSGGGAEIGGSAIDHFADDQLASCTNVAAGQPASQSSEAYGGEASRAVDGSMASAWGSGSCSHTQNKVPPWWQVDLGSTKEVRAVQLVNRADCCQDRLVGARVIVSTLADYTSDPSRPSSCGSVTQAESEAQGC